MAYCGNCGQTLEAGWKFCERCGKPVEGGPAHAPSQENGETSDQCMASTKSGSRCRRRAAQGHVVCSIHLGSEPTVLADQRTGNGSDDVTAPLPTVAVSRPVGPPPGIPAAPQPAYAMVSSRRDRSAIKVAALAAAAAVVLLALALGIANNVGTHRRLDDTRKDLATTDRELATTRGELAARTAERDDLQTKLSAAEKELGGTKQSLTDTRSKVDAQAGQIDALKTCLNGVITSLDVAGTGDTDEAFRILDSVEGACERSSELL